jgi:hypothetical protein
VATPQRRDDLVGLVLRRDRIAPAVNDAVPSAQTCPSGGNSRVGLPVATSIANSTS